ncbi:rhodanese-like domain-containing protein [Streptomyces sp. NPDC014734]|uniref:rhodanese-like domain-containing protein n=1 Tax=Streptomyces sp. NPDC014734 TaxID=3364886 RepID=UPI00370141C8
MSPIPLPPPSLSALFRRGPGRVGPVEADRLTADGTAVLLDVREASEWHAGHAPGAVHLPLSRLVDGASLPGRAEDRPVVVICRSGNRSRRAARVLAERGVQATDVVGGMSAWAAEGLPVRDRRGAAGTVI